MQFYTEVDKLENFDLWASRISGESQPWLNTNPNPY